ncbi:U3 small nucleolar ribonucleoprotein protein MPP10, putative [Plasmodium relictum]|uniref:U3 small nucleolar ribonucleoprotein protein MPP10, putative n=1 Tax=Plasmodium relictum TaxID=85471 RepID=A0A1J1H2P9_PLARL|nr:U3 small nucleolar ribonucleoprotein protein MPP10, putative [Plasmodium relictum]CRG99132.1 U3 small nucleolar ribonucleoprotein protein MPP10, putative [Plasmodium relictum]
MEESIVKKYIDIINLLHKNTQIISNKNNEKEKNELIEMIEYFSNILIKYFYDEFQMDNISISKSEFDSDQLWYFIECLIKEKKLKDLSNFFNSYEKKIEKNENKRKDQINSSKLEEEAKIEKKNINNCRNNDNEILKRKRKVNEDKEDTNENVGKKKKEEENNENEKKKNNEITEIEDKFFNFNEMEEFLDKEEKRVLHNQTEDNSEEDLLYASATEYDLNEFNCSYKEAKELKYHDFYKDKKEIKEKKRKNNEENENEYDEEEDKNENENEEDENEEDEDENENENEYDEEEDENENEEDENEEDEDENENENEYDEEEDENENENEEDENEEDEDEDENENENEYDEEEDENEEDEEENKENKSFNEYYDAEESNVYSKNNNKYNDEKIERELDEMNEFDSMHSESEDPNIHDMMKDKEKIEKELIEKKHWSLTGEVFGYDRPKNSILKLNVDIPKINTYNKNDVLINKNIGNVDNSSENEESDNKKKNNKINSLTEEIELVVKQRIKNMLFDDVEKKCIEDLDITDNNNNDEVNFDNLNFSKSKVSLVDEYTKKYEEEIKNSQSKNKEINLQKIEIMNIFKKIMHCCDSLSNDYYIPKPVLLNDKNNKIASLNIEECVPIILSDKSKKAPEEIFKPNHIKQPNEMNKQEKKSLRKSKKVKRKKNLLHHFKDSNINELKNRNNYLMEKNKKQKEEKLNKIKFGISLREKLSLDKSDNRYNFNKDIARAINFDKKKK